VPSPPPPAGAAIVAVATSWTAARQDGERQGDDEADEHRDRGRLKVLDDRVPEVTRTGWC